MVIKQTTGILTYVAIYDFIVVLIYCIKSSKTGDVRTVIKFKKTKGNVMKVIVVLLLAVLMSWSSNTLAKGKFGIDAYSLTKAVCYQGSTYKSTFQKVGNRRWQEINERGTRINWQEQNRDEWSVYLKDPSRKMNLQIDLHTTKISWGNYNQGTHNELCRIKSTNNQDRAPAPARAQSQEQLCESMIQGKVAWARGGSKSWSPTNVKNLCRNSKNAANTVQCFKSEINRHNNWQKGIKRCSGNKRAIDAGPIWNQNDANNKCPQIASRNGGTWTGGWWTTVQGKMSVCEVQF